MQSGICPKIPIPRAYVHCESTKYTVASVIGFIKGKSAIAVALLRGKERDFVGEIFWALEYYVLSVGLNEEQIKRYIRSRKARM